MSTYCCSSFVQDSVMDDQSAIYSRSFSWGFPQFSPIFNWLRCGFRIFFCSVVFSRNLICLIYDSEWYSVTRSHHWNSFITLWTSWLVNFLVSWLQSCTMMAFITGHIIKYISLPVWAITWISSIYLTKFNWMLNRQNNISHFLNILWLLLIGLSN